MQLSPAQRRMLQELVDGEWHSFLNRLTARSLVRGGLLEYKRASMHMWRITAKGRDAIGDTSVLSMNR
jgi:hypothetical protein